MLKNLVVINFGIIDKISIDFDTGFNLITGETGAGKSLLIDALKIVCGGRFSQSYLQENKKQCLLSATFIDCLKNKEVEKILNDNAIELDNNEIIIRRVFTKTTSKNFINDVPVTLNLIKIITTYFIDLHGQFEHQTLLYSDYQLNYIDKIAKNNKLLKEYSDKYLIVKSINEKIKEIENLKNISPNELDWKKFQLKELNKLEFTDEDYNELLKNVKVFENSKNIISNLSEITNYLYNSDNSVLDNISKHINDVEKFVDYSDIIKNNIEKLNTINELIKDVNSDFNYLLEDLNSDNIDVDLIQKQIYDIQNLMRKNNCSSIKELILLKNNLETELSEIENAQKQIDLLNQNLKKEKTELLNIAKKITKSRKKTIKKIEKEINNTLSNLNMASTTFLVELFSNENNITNNGIDNVVFSVQSNNQKEIKPIKDILSGGELSRMMLALKSLIAELDDIPTLIFDEIDSGISGDTASKVAEEIFNISRFRQIMCVTHQPAIAALKANHFKIQKNEEKDSVSVELIKLKNNERIKEIANLMSGGKITKTLIKSAKELMVV